MTAPHPVPIWAPLDPPAGRPTPDTSPITPPPARAPEPWPPNGRYRPPPVVPPAPPARSHLPPAAGRAPTTPPPARPPWRVRALVGVGITVAVAGTVGVAAAAFSLSFDAIQATATAAHVTASLAWLYPVAVDGAMSVALVCAVLLRAMGRRPWYPWLVMLVGAAISIGCNALHAYVEGGAIALPRSWAMLVSAMPGVLLALSVHLIVQLAIAAYTGAQPPPGAGRPAPQQDAARRPEPAPPEPPEVPARRPAPAPPEPPEVPARRPAPQPPEVPARRPAPEARGGPWPSIEELADTLTREHPGVRLRNEEAAATLRRVHHSCADRRAREAAKIHNGRLSGEAA